jgi:hypothetical protein
MDGPCRRMDEEDEVHQKAIKVSKLLVSFTVWFIYNNNFVCAADVSLSDTF